MSSKTSSRVNRFASISARLHHTLTTLFHHPLVLESLLYSLHWHLPARLRHGSRSEAKQGRRRGPPQGVTNGEITPEFDDLCILVSMDTPETDFAVFHRRIWAPLVGNTSLPQMRLYSVSRRWTKLNAVGTQILLVQSNSGGLNRTKPH